MSDCWINIMPKGCAHSFHLHPQSVVSGTYYVQTPRGASGLKFEDPRLAQLMAAPPRRSSAPPAMKAHLTYPAKAGHLILFESWLRHEVPASRIDTERVSISFNRSEEHTSELQSLMRISYAVFCLKKKQKKAKK